MNRIPESNVSYTGILLPKPQSKSSEVIVLAADIESNTLKCQSSSDGLLVIYLRYCYNTFTRHGKILILQKNTCL